MMFKHLDVGDRFIFLVEQDANYSGERGPWIKVAMHRYVHVDQPALTIALGTWHAQVIKLEKL